MSNDYGIVDKDGNRLSITENEGMFSLEAYPSAVSLTKPKLLETACALLRVYWLHASEEEKNRLQFEIRAQVPARGML